jgi:hypothetical protein
MILVPSPVHSLFYAAHHHTVAGAAAHNSATMNGCAAHTVLWLQPAHNSQCLLAFLSLVFVGQIIDDGYYILVPTQPVYIGSTHLL